jgi:peptide/nickel transport system substrate-binding protein
VAQSVVQDVAQNPDRLETPHRGGTLRLVGAGDVDHLDPALAYHTVTRGLLRACTRQLVSYVAAADRDAAGRIVADLATELPPATNAGRSWTFTLRDGLRWNTGRPLVAADVVRGIKRLAHPLAPSPGLPYYLSTVAGLAEFRDEVAAGPQHPAAIGERIEDTALAGVTAVSEREIRFETVQPVGDFLNMLALPFATPAPVEYLRHRPGSPELEQALSWNGPYAVSRYLPGQRIELDRNPAWDRATDPLRAAWVDRIEIRQQVSEPDAHRLVADGRADMLWDVQPLTEELPELLSTADERLEVYPAGLLSPYLVINFDSPDNGQLLKDVSVRRALQYAVDKAAVAAVWGGPQLNDVADQILPPLCAAHRPTAYYPTAGGRGDPERARALLTAAGYPGGVTLRLVFRDRDIHPETARVVRDALSRAGIRLELVPAGIPALFEEYLAPPADAPRGRWDLALTGWEPDWYGNNARTYLQPLADGRDAARGGDWGTNYGHYRNQRADALLTEATSCLDPERAGELFRQLEDVVMQDAALVPVLFAHQYWMHARRVRNWLPYPVLNGDLTNLWLDGPPTASDDDQGMDG